MSIVFITIPGQDKEEFANLLHERTGGGLSLVVVQRRRRRSLAERLARFVRRHRWGVVRETWYTLLLRLQGPLRGTLDYFRARGEERRETRAHRARVLEVESVNSREVLQVLQELSPDILVVWAGTIIQPHILATAKRAVNLHFGLCPHYRGALANQDAILRNDLEKIGATIHYINGELDAGEILATVTADVARPPLELFRSLNDRAVDKYLEIVTKLYAQEELPRVSQDISMSRNLLLRDWTPRVRYHLARRIKAWEYDG